MSVVMSDLVEFLNARLDMEAQIAREATPGPWQNASTARHHVTVSGRSEEAVFASPPDTGAMVVAVTGEARERHNLVNAEHIALHDPARVLSEVEAKRRIIAEHMPTPVDPVSQYTDEPFGCETCHHSSEQGVMGFGLCATLKLLALPYAGHPEYLETWKP